MPESLLPDLLRSLHVSLHRLLSSLLSCCRAYEHLAFGTLRKGYLTAYPVNLLIDAGLPRIYVVFQEGFGFCQGLRHPTHPLDPGCLEATHIRLAIHAAIGNIETCLFISLAELLVQRLDRCHQGSLITAIAVQRAQKQRYIAISGCG